MVLEGHISSVARVSGGPVMEETVGRAMAWGVAGTPARGLG